MENHHYLVETLLSKTACEGGLIPAHSGSIVSYEGYRTSFLSRRTRSGISAGLRDQQRPSASRVGGEPGTTVSPHANTVHSGAGKGRWAASATKRMRWRANALTAKEPSAVRTSTSIAAFGWSTLRLKSA